MSEKNLSDLSPENNETEIDCEEDNVNIERISNSLEEVADSFDTRAHKMEEVDLELKTSYELDLQIEGMTEKNKGIWKCNICDKTSSEKSTIKTQAETHIEGISHVCHICNKTLSTRHSLQSHISRSHSGLTFSCNICGKSGITRGAYTNRKNRNHQLVL